MVCNLCGSRNSKVLFASTRYPDGYPFDVLQCRSCGLVFRDFSLSSHFFLKQGTNTWSRRSCPDKYTARKMLVFNFFIEFISPFRKLNRILDVGSGQGLFLKLCSDNYWQVWGLEVDPRLAKYSKKHYNIEVFNGSLEESQYQENFFDAITFINVLEHLPDPYFAIKESHRLLRPGGCLLIRFTNAAFHVQFRRLFSFLRTKWGGIGRFNPSTIHLYAFNRASISSYLHRAGFRQEIIKNSIFTKYHEVAQGNTVQWSMLHVAKFAMEIIGRLSNGRALVAPSLFAAGFK